MKIIARAVRRALHEANREWHLLANSGALVIGAAITAVLGFLFWWFAARFFPPHAVGLAAAMISIMSLLGLIGEFGLGTLLMAESQRGARDAPGLISAALLAALASSILFGAACLGLASLAPLKLGSVLASTDYSLLFVVGCAVTGFVVTLDGALVGLLQSSLQMYRKVAFSVLKLALLPAFAFLVPWWPQEITIFLAWVLGNLLSILVLLLFPACRGHALWSAPNFMALKRQVSEVFGHHLLNLAAEGPGLVLPYLVTVIFAADINAAFYAAWMIFNVVLLVPAALTTIQFTMGSLQPGAIASRMIFSLWLCMAVSIVAGIGLMFMSGWMLGWFGPSYAAIGGPMLQVLGLGVFAVTLKHHYIAVQRLQGRMVRAAMLVGLGGAAELAFAILGAEIDGLQGFTWGWLCAACLEAAFMIPSVWRAARSHERPYGGGGIRTGSIGRPLSFAAYRRLAVPVWPDMRDRLPMLWRRR
ncbi:oligosaccharide flippase family protein [Microbacteriaceae bacterium K1510]|nr:oligosaccharide flippase family protein [Microbacteriaceae bacterium K1510]